jgi:two-component system, NtrC family, response regulator HydG
MSGNFALIGSDPRFTSVVLGQLKAAHPQLAVAQHSYDTVREHLERNSGVSLALLVSLPADAEHAVRLVQEVAIRKMSTRLVIVQADAAAHSETLNHLKAHPVPRLAWSNDAEALATFARDSAHHHHGNKGSGTDLVDIMAGRLLSFTPSLIPLADRLALAAEHEVTVLITGETGTGKTFLARLLHDNSPRKQYPFLAVPCGALPANLVESAFFGHAKGAFTGADRAKEGKFEAAGNGTILLDEIDTLGLEQQAALLRVIETGEFEPVGSNETHRCRARIIVASNWNLDEAVEEGRFRRDLYYRLNVMSFHLPPLRERVQDIAPLVRGLVSRYNTKFRKELFDISAEAMACIESYPWPGNIRQLENVMQQAVLLCAGPQLLTQHLPPVVRDYSMAQAQEGATSGQGGSAVRGGSAQESTDSLLHNRELLERSVIQRALANNGYSRARAAHALGISRVTLYKKMKKYGLMHGSRVTV